MHSVGITLIFFNVTSISICIREEEAELRSKENSITFHVVLSAFEALSLM
jgi:hypothetical protein